MYVRLPLALARAGGRHPANIDSHAALHKANLTAFLQLSTYLPPYPPTYLPIYLSAYLPTLRSICTRTRGGIGLLLLAHLPKLSLP